jgi:hypothetical protein
MYPTVFETILEKRKLRVSQIAISTRRAMGDGIVWLSAGARRYRVAWRLGGGLRSRHPVFQTIRA